MERDPLEVTRMETPPQCSRLGIVLGVLVGVAYYGFLAAGALAPKEMAKTAIGGMPWSFILGGALLVFIVCTAGIYTLYANGADERA
jgi:putative solute:sodium symporter small subunit